MPVGLYDILLYVHLFAAWGVIAGAAVVLATIVRARRGILMNERSIDRAGLMLKFWTPVALATGIWRAIGLGGDYELWVLVVDAVCVVGIFLLLLAVVFAPRR